MLFYYLPLNQLSSAVPHASSLNSSTQGVCTEAGMYALRERRVHVTQEDFEMAVAKVRSVYSILYLLYDLLLDV